MQIVQENIAKLGISGNSSKPNGPIILETSSNSNLVWMGSAGARNYSIVTNDNPPSVIASNIVDNFGAGDFKYDISSHVESLGGVSIQVIAHGDWGNVTSLPKLVT